MPDAGAPVPVTLLCGFLGAGKTTLLNHLLEHAGGRRLGVLVNDFGAVNVDAALVTGVPGGPVALRGGCVCCTVRDDLLEAAFRLLDGPRPVDHLVVEASGVADPHPLVFTFALPHLRSRLRLDGVVAVVDPEHLAAVAGGDGVDEETAALTAAQVRAAGLVVLTKTDLAPPADVEAARAWIAAHAPGARVLAAVRGAVEPALLLGAGAAPDARRDAAPAHGAFATWHYHAARPFRSLPAVREALRRLPDGVVRAKGLVQVVGAPAPIVLQVAGGRVDFHPAPDAARSSATDLVFIGRPGAVTDADVQATFDAALESS